MCIVCKRRRRRVTCSTGPAGYYSVCAILPTLISVYSKVAVQTRRRAAFAAFVGKFFPVSRGVKISGRHETAAGQGTASFFVRRRNFGFYPPDSAAAVPRAQKTDRRAIRCEGLRLGRAER